MAMIIVKTIEGWIVHSVWTGAFRGALLCVCGVSLHRCLYMLCFEAFGKGWVGGRRKFKDGGGRR